LMQHGTYWERFQNESFSFIELNYALVQAYDFLHLYREFGCILQIGGNDQWFNILAGRDLIRRAEGGEAFALTTPLVTTTSGEKLGKTAGNAVWLDPRLTSPYDYYQYWRNTEDADVGRFLRMFTFRAAACESMRNASTRATEWSTPPSCRRCSAWANARSASLRTEARLGHSTVRTRELADGPHQVVQIERFGDAGVDGHRADALQRVVHSGDDHDGHP